METMTPEEQRITIAEARGWEMMGCISKWKDPSGKIHKNWAGFCSCPDYLNDLNAMHEAEKVIPREIFSRYMAILAGIVNRDSNPECDHFANRSTATAAQRCEAFLKTLKLWTS